MAESIQCWSCGTRMTLEELASNDGDCPECDVEIHLAEYLSKALTDNAALRAQQSSQGGEAVAWYTEDHLSDKSATTYDPEVAERWRTKGWPVTPLYTHPADQVAEGVARELLEHWADKLEDSESNGYGWEDALAAELRALLADCEEVKK